MCGRYTRKYSWKQVHDFLQLTFPSPDEMGPDTTAAGPASEPAAPLAPAARAIPAWNEPSYNVAPTHDSPVARMSRDGARELVPARWGLVPFWADDPSIGSRMINARAEGLADKPAFRHAWKARRCLIPVSGFYEWQARPGQNVKQPWYFAPADGGILCFAGLWERWSRGPGPALDTFTVITTAAGDFMSRFHERTPVILQLEQFAAWLDPATDEAALRAMLAPPPAGVLDAWPVGPRVNKPAENDPALIDRAEPLPEAPPAPPAAKPRAPRRGKPGPSDGPLLY